MKKRLFTGILAIAGMLFATSCSQDDILNVSNSDGFVNATFTIGTTDGIATRATIGNGTKADKVACTVYDANGEEMDLYQVVDVVEKTATYNVRLAKGQDYRVAFFAYNSSADAYDVRDLKNVKINASQLSNIEERDAFTNYVDITAEQTMNTINQDVTLYRPFAQLNLGIDGQEFTDAKKSGVVIAKSYIKVSNVYDVFSAYDNAIASTATPVTMEFALNDVPGEQLEVDINRNNNIEEDEYFTYLALNYLLVGDIDSEKSLTDVEFVWETANGKTNLPTTSFINIPVQRNYRTNIIGKLVTNPASFNIVIDEKFENSPKEDYIVDINGVIYTEITTAEALQEAVNNASVAGDYVIKMAADIADAQIMIAQYPNVNLVIDGCNFKFDGSFSIHNRSNYNNGTLAIKNVNFETSTPSLNFVMPNDFGVENGVTRRYSNNVTVENCSFTALGTAEYTVVGVQAKSTQNLKVVNCTATKLHSLVQAQSCVTDVIVDNANIDDCKNGVAFKQVKNAVVANSAITTNAYGIRFDGNTDNYAIAVKGCNINADQPFIVRKMTGANNIIALEGANIFTTTQTYQVVITNGSDDETYSTPTGTYTLTGVEGFVVYPTN